MDKEIPNEVSFEMFVQMQAFHCYSGPPRGKRDGVIRHISKREKRNCMKKLRYCVTDQSGIRRDRVNLT